MARRPFLADQRTVYISLLAIGIGAIAAVISRLLTILIGTVTNLAYYGRLSTTFASPAGHHLGAWGVLIPVGGGIVVGLMARFGSKAIRGHGIPEAMEQIRSYIGAAGKCLDFCPRDDLAEHVIEVLEEWL